MGVSSESDRYRVLSEHFQACAELPPEEREKYISGPIVTDPEMRRELRALLKYHLADLEPPTPPPLPVVAVAHDTRSRRGRRSRTALAILGLGLGATALLLAAVQWMLGRLEADLRKEALETLVQRVEAQTAAIRAWADRQKAFARSFVNDPALAAHIAALVEISDDSSGDPQKLQSSPSYKPVSDFLKQAPQEIGERGFLVVSPGGIGLCANPEITVGRPIAPTGAAYLRRGVLGEWILSRPYADRQFTKGLAPDYRRQVMFVGGPVCDGAGKIVAMVGFRFDPHREFYGLLPQGSGTMMAFDEKGVLLNDIGNPEDLQRCGLLDGIPEGESGLLRLRLRDPGGDLTRGYRPGTAPETWMPTLLARHATEGERAGSSGEYRDILGRPVIGAWTWLPEWEMGVGAEQELRRVLSPMRPVALVSYLFLLLPLGITAGVLLTSRSFRSLFGGTRESTFGSYVLERSIGKGGMAEVFLARHEILKRPAAVKILSHPDPDAGMVARFEREARLACRLGHPNTIQIFDYGETPEGKLYYAMEYVKGVNLAQLMAMESALPVARVVHLLRQIAGALEEANTLGLVHRDLKPSNIMVCSKGGLVDLVKVLDFGIACSALPATEDFTRSVELVGTPAYIAPERIRNPQNQDPRSDIYSFGAVAFHLLTGRNVFEGPGPAELIYQVMTARRPSPSQLRGDLLPLPLEQLVVDCLAIEPEARPADFQDVLEILDSIATKERWDQAEAREWWNANRARLTAFA
jgi:tRNA A-37 threonylcarbamoyl transferase component Bud32